MSAVADSLATVWEMAEGFEPTFCFNFKLLGVWLANFLAGGPSFRVTAELAGPAFLTLSDLTFEKKSQRRKTLWYKKRNVQDSLVQEAVTRKTLWYKKRNAQDSLVQEAQRRKTLWYKKRNVQA
eukprot:CAMPEP_0173325762 /NCGR_PEP_ID=MMETSP1144-20121109/698_1 /TAXON_ID=483371 /ORGANISM="non described non described, Strain CCMP2298" /LENGTH=123 /DNA_ID=CAMNT_0014270013 /DNA_START=244 /DNA_END=616 /DNA_ORIENTATION=-